MSLSTNSSTGSPYATVNPGAGGGGGVVHAISEVPTKIAAGVADVGEAVGDAASATVSFSARAMQALADGAMAVVHGAEDVIAFPFEMAADAVAGMGDAVEGGIHVIANGVHAAIDGVESVVNGAESAAHAVAIDLPAAIASDVAGVTQTAMNDATTVAGAAAGVAALSGSPGIKAIGALF